MDDDGKPRAEEFDDVLHLGPRRAPRTAVRGRHARTIRVALWSVGVVAVAAAFASQLAADPPAHRSHGPSVAPSDEASTRPPVTATQAALAQVAALADRSTPLTDYVRQTSPAHACAAVAVGRSPVHAVTAVLTKALPGFVVEDVGRTLDQFTGMCSLQLRAIRPDGTVLVLSIAAPSPGAHGPAGAGSASGQFSNGRTATRFGAATTRSRWVVLVGVTGASVGLPATADLLRLAGRPGLTW